MDELIYFNKILAFSQKLNNNEHNLNSKAEEQT